MAKMTKEEIQAAGRVIREIAWKNGYDGGKYFADKLKDDMTSHRNTSPEDIRIFEEATGYLWESSSIQELLFLEAVLVLYVLVTVIMGKKKSNNILVPSRKLKKH